LMGGFLLLGWGFSLLMSMQHQVQEGWQAIEYMKLLIENQITNKLLTTTNYYNCLAEIAGALHY
jgi:hypothetical protein